MPGPFDFESELSALKSKQKLAEAMRESAMTGTLRTGGGLGGLITALMRPRMLDRMDQENTAAHADLQSRYKSQLGQEVDNYLTTRQGRGENMFNPQEIAAAGGGAGVPQLPERPAQPADPRRAAVGAFASQFPQLQELGKADLATMGKANLTPKDVMGFSGMDPKTKILAATLVSAGVPEAQVLQILKPELKEHVVNGQVVRQGESGGYGVAGDFRDQFGGVGPVAQGPNGPIFGQANRGTGEVKFAPAGNSVNVNTAQKAGDRFAGALAEKRADAISKSFDSAQSAGKSIQALDMSKQQLDAGIKSGSMAQVDLALNKLGETLGLPRDPTNSNTEAYMAAIAQQVAQFVKNFGAGTGISNTDLEFALRSMGGDIGTSTAALQQILDMAKVGATNVLISHQRLLDAQKGASGALPEDIRSFEVPFDIPGDNMRYSPGADRMLYNKPKPPKAAAPGTAPSRKLSWGD